jgi:hypothetical protein
VWVVSDDREVEDERTGGMSVTAPPRSEHLEHAVEEPGVQRLGVSRAGVYGQGTSHAGTE